jgi:hypothetical protein
VEKGTVPPSHEGKATVAGLQYQMLAGHPFVHTQEDVLFGSWLQRQDLPKAPSKVERARLREEFFSKPQPCLRASPLPKKFGWGLLFDEQGRVALCPMESAEYRRLAGGREKKVLVLKAMRTSRAKG